MSILDIKELKILNFGLKIFEQSLKKQNTDVVQIDWKPEANGNIRLLEIIDKLEEMG